MPTQLSLADGTTVLVEDTFDAVLDSARAGDQMIELHIYEPPSEVKRHGYEDVKTEARLAVNPAHIVSVKSAD